MEPKKRGRPSQDKVIRPYTIDRKVAEYIDSLPDGDRSRFVNNMLVQGIAEEKLSAKVSSKEITEVIDSLHSAMVRWPGSWSEDHRFAWIYGIIVGWENEEEICKKFHWDEETRNRFRQYRQVIEKLEPVDESH